MNCRCCSSLGLLLSLAAALPASGQELSGDTTFQAFLPQWEKAQTGFINGDPTLWKLHSSRSDDATIFGAFGGHEKGGRQVAARYDWASSQFTESGARQQIEYLTVTTGDDLAVTVSVERQERVRIGGQAQPAPRALRVTQVFPKENGSWKLLHRHADPMVARLPAGLRR